MNTIKMKAVDVRKINALNKQIAQLREAQRQIEEPYKARECNAMLWLCFRCEDRIDKKKFYGYVKVLRTDGYNLFCLHFAQRDTYTVIDSDALYHTDTLRGYEPISQDEYVRQLIRVQNNIMTVAGL